MDFTFVLSSQFLACGSPSQEDIDSGCRVCLAGDEAGWFVCAGVCAVTVLVESSSHVRSLSCHFPVLIALMLRASDFLL